MTRRFVRTSLALDMRTIRQCVRIRRETKAVSKQLLFLGDWTRACTYRRQGGQGPERAKGTRRAHGLCYGINF